MVDIEKSIADCCKQLRLSSNFSGQAMTQKGDTQQEYLLNLLTNEIEYRLTKRKSKYLNTAGFPRRYAVDEFRTDEIDFPDGVNLESLLNLDFYHSGKNVIMYGGTGTGKTMQRSTVFVYCNPVALGEPMVWTVLQKKWAIPTLFRPDSRTD